MLPAKKQANIQTRKVYGRVNTYLSYYNKLFIKDHPHSLAVFICIYLSWHLHFRIGVHNKLYCCVTYMNSTFSYFVRILGRKCILLLLSFVFLAGMTLPTALYPTGRFGQQRSTSPLILYRKAKRSECTPAVLQWPCSVF